jgi:cytochrome c oxidase subunit IV
MSERIISPRAYYVVFAALIGLTLLTVYMSFVRLPGELWHTVVGLAIATVKALLVTLIFMHVLYSSRLTWLIILSMLFWLALLIGLTMNDYLTRGSMVY